MKKTKKLLSIVACLNFLSSCNKVVDSSSPSSTITSTITSESVKNKTVEELNEELFENYSVIAIDDYVSICWLTNFNDEIPEEYLNLETIIIPKTIKGMNVTSIYCSNKAIFSIFTKVKTIKIPSTIQNIVTNDYENISSPFANLPNLENIEVDKDNPYYHTEGNCLIRTKEKSIVCGWKEVVIPEGIKTIRNYAFCKNDSITSITLNNDLETLAETTGSTARTYVFTYLPNLKSINSNGNTRYESKEGSNILYDKINNKIVAACGEATIDEEYTSYKELNLSYFSSLTRVTLNKNITTIKAKAFIKTQLKSIHIPSTLTNIDQNGLSYITTLETVTADTDSKYKIDPGNFMYDSKDINKILAAWGKVTIPDNITNLSGLYYKQSITEVKIGKDVTTIDSSIFPSIDSGKEYKDFVKITIDEENTNFKLNETSLVKLNDDGSQSLISVQPNEQGEVEIPAEVKIIDRRPGFNYYTSTLKSIKFNEGLEEIKKVDFNYFSDSNMITKLDLPKSLKKVEKNSETGLSFFSYLSNIEDVTIAGEKESDYFRIETSCLIQKNGFDSIDRFIFGWGDVVIPDYIVKLGAGEFYQLNSITSLTIHKNIKDYVTTENNSTLFPTFSNMKIKNSGPIYYKGTIEDFKKPIGSSQSFYEIFTGYTYSSYVHYFLKKDGTYDGPYTKEQLKNL